MAAFDTNYSQRRYISRTVKLKPVIGFDFANVLDVLGPGGGDVFTKSINAE